MLFLCIHKVNNNFNNEKILFVSVGSTEDAKNTPDSSKLSVKKPRPKAASPNRQGPQQCQVRIFLFITTLFD